MEVNFKLELKDGSGSCACKGDRKNAIDSKVKRTMSRFVRLHGAPSTLVLLAEDIDYAPDLSDYRNQDGIYIILIYNKTAHYSLLSCAHEHYPMSSLTDNLPLRRGVEIETPVQLVISSLPDDSKKNLKRALLQLSGNAGGKVLEINGSEAILKFANANWAEKAMRRMDEETIGPNTIKARILPQSETGGNFPRPSTSRHVDDVSSLDESVGAIESDSEETEEYSDFEMGNTTRMPLSAEGSSLRSTPAGLDVNPEEDSSTASVPVVSPAQRRSFSDSETEEEPQKKKKPKLPKKHWRKHQRRH